MTSLSRLSLSVLLATGAVVGCGDDGAPGPIVMVDAGESSASTSSSGVSTNGNPGTPTDETTGPTPMTSDVETTDEGPTPTVDGGDTASSELDGSVGGDVDGGETTGGDVANSSSEACGAQGELCCAAGGGQGTCDDGFVCNNPPGGGLGNSECVVAAPVGDGGDPTSAPACGGEGELCCSSGGFGGTCDEGFVCNNPAGGGLSNSECVVATPVGDGGDVTSAPACGGEGELCCSSGGPAGTCDEGFVCNNPAGGGLSNSECLAETPVTDSGTTDAATAVEDAGGATDAAAPAEDAGDAGDAATP